jgi:hypothetical protein
MADFSERQAMLAKTGSVIGGMFDILIGHVSLKCSLSFGGKEVFCNLSSGILWAWRSVSISKDII